MGDYINVTMKCPACQEKSPFWVEPGVEDNELELECFACDYKVKIRIEVPGPKQASGGVPDRRPEDPVQP